MTKNICISLHCDSEALTITERKQTKVINILKFAELSHKKESSPSVRELRFVYLIICDMLSKPIFWR